jgi:hypothetical protein
MCDCVPSPHANFRVTDAHTLSRFVCSPTCAPAPRAKPWLPRTKKMADIDNLIDMLKQLELPSNRNVKAIIPDHVCMTCGEEFDSKGELTRHLRGNDHFYGQEQYRADLATFNEGVGMPKNTPLQPSPDEYDVALEEDDELCDEYFRLKLLNGAMEFLARRS